MRETRTKLNWLRTLSAALAAAALFGCAPQIPPEEPERTPSAIIHTARPTAQATPKATPPATQPAEQLASDYLPFEDIFLSYYDNVSGFAFQSAIEFFSEENGLIQRHFTGPGKNYIEVTRYMGGAVTRYYRLDGISYLQNFTPYVPPDEREVLIQEPIRVGTKWAVPGGERVITSVNRRMAFPGLGEFTVLEVTTNYDDRSVLVQHYMKNVGLVAQCLVGADGMVVDDLKVFERDKARSITQNVRFYYVSPGENALRYVDRVLILRTNADLRARFADEWRNVPPGSGLLPLSSDVRITRMFSDPKQERVIVDFSGAFMANMELSPQTRGLLIQAVVNTLSDYYEIERVYIYVEGAFIQEEEVPQGLDFVSEKDGPGYVRPSSGALEYKQ